MKSWRRCVIVGVLALSGLPGVAWAQSDMDLLLDLLVRKGILSNSEAGLVRQEVAQATEARTQQAAKEIAPGSAPGWRWQGDIRLRNEYRNKVETGADRNRQRIRVRYGAEGAISDQLKATFRMATGGIADPVSTNQSFDTFFNKKTVVFDLANLRYAPEIPGIDEAVLTGGMMLNPLWTAGPLVWDPDLSWDGAALSLAKETDRVRLFSNSGMFSLDTDETESASLWVIQGGAVLTPFADAEEDLLKYLKLTAALAYHDYRNVANSAKAGTDPITRETQNTAGAKDFNQLNPSGELAMEVGGVPVALFGDWVHNASAGTEDNDGFQVGLKVGKAATPWSFTKGWEAGYVFQELEADAVFDEFADSDFNDGGTNNRGHVFWITVATLKHSTLGVKYLKAEQLTGTKANEDRVQLDWLTKF